MLSKMTKNADPINRDNAQQHHHHVRGERLPVHTPCSWHLEIDEKGKNKAQALWETLKTKQENQSWNALTRKIFHEETDHLISHQASVL